MGDVLEKTEYISSTLLTNVLKDLERDFKITKSVSPEYIRNINAICGGGVVLRASEYLDSNKVVRYRSQNGFRFVYKISGSSETRIIMADVNFCRCQYYIREVLAGKAMLCKHVLAVKLAEITGRIQEETLTDAQLVELLNMQLVHLREDEVRINAI